MNRLLVVSGNDLAAAAQGLFYLIAWSCFFGTAVGQSIRMPTVHPVPRAESVGGTRSVSLSPGVETFTIQSGGNDHRAAHHMSQAGPSAIQPPSTQFFTGSRSHLCPRCGVDEATQCCCSDGSWRQRTAVPFDLFSQGEYVGPARASHVPDYRLRVDDQITLVYRLTRELIPGAYEFNVGDTIRIERDSVQEDPNAQNTGFDRILTVAPDGTITLPLIGRVRAAGRSVEQLRKEIEKKSKRFFKLDLWTVTPETVDTRLNDLRNSVDARQGAGGQSIDLRVSPDGTVAPPALNRVSVQGLTLDEVKFELDQRYINTGFRGIEVSPILVQRAPTFVYVLGEVAQPGRFELQRPTTVMQSIALAGGWDIGGNLRQIVVFRRAEDWRVIATKLNLAQAMWGNRPTPADEIFVRDNDLVLVPKSPIQQVDDVLELFFTRGLNRVLAAGQAFGILEQTTVQQ